MQDGKEKVIIAASESMRNILNYIEKTAGSDDNVIISGETGTGKTMLAQEIHRRSRRNNGPLIIVDGGTTAVSLLEGELFGHMKGSFTGAINTEKGLIEMADKGTLIIDGLENIPPEIQHKLLHTIEHKAIRRIGGRQSIPIDIRFIGISRKNLMNAIKEGYFLDALYHRLGVLEIEIPPLRARREDIIPLASQMLKRITQEQGKEKLELDDLPIKLLKEYNYPGNAWELLNAITHAIFVETGPRITSHSLPVKFISQIDVVSSSTDSSSQGYQITIGGANFSLDNELENFERTLITKAFLQSKAGLFKTAKLLNIGERSLRYRCDKLKIDYSIWGRPEYSRIEQEQTSNASDETTSDAQENKDPTENNP